MNVKDAMNKDVKTCRPDSTVKEAAVEMNKYNIGSLVVVSGTGQVVGIMTERDILTDVVAQGKNASDVKVEDIMSTHIITVSPDKSLEDAADIMTRNHIKKLPVVDHGKLVGIITATDLIAVEKNLIEKIAFLLSAGPSLGGISG